MIWKPYDNNHEDSLMMAAVVCRNMFWIAEVWKTHLVHVKLVLQTEHHEMQGTYNIKNLLACVL
jgi:hypothetical protein